MSANLAMGRCGHQSGLEFGRCDISARYAIEWNMPDTSAEGSDVDLGWIFGVGLNAVAPFEVVARDASPVFAPVVRDPGRRFEAGCVKSVWIPRVDGDVVDVTIPV